MKRIAVAALAASIITPFTLQAPAAEAAEKVPPLPGCTGKYRFQYNNWYHSVHATAVNPFTRHVEDGHNRGVQQVGYWFCPGLDKPAKLTPTWVKYGYDGVTGGDWLRVCFWGVSNRMWMYDSHEDSEGTPAHRNWNMKWHRVSEDHDEAPEPKRRVLFYDAPGNINNGEFIWFRMKDEPRRKGEMEVHVRVGIDPNAMYRTASNGTVRHFHPKTDPHGAWRIPGATVPERPMPAGVLR